MAQHVPHQPPWPRHTSPCPHPFPPPSTPAEAKAAAAGAGKAAAFAQAAASATASCLYRKCDAFFTPPDCCGANNAASVAAGRCGCVGWVPVGHCLPACLLWGVAVRTVRPLPPQHPRPARRAAPPVPGFCLIMHAMPPPPAPGHASPADPRPPPLPSRPPPLQHFLPLHAGELVARRLDQHLQPARHGRDVRLLERPTQLQTVGWSPAI